jgi:hypothetical protein
MRGDRTAFFYQDVELSIRMAFSRKAPARNARHILQLNREASLPISAELNGSKSMKTKAGKFRKSRRLRLNISSGWGAERKFTPEPPDWRRIETAYGHQFNDADRDAIVVLVDKYFFWQPSEARAPFVDDATRYLDRLEKVAKRFWDVLLEQSQTPMTGVGDHAHIAEEAEMRGVAIGFVQSHFGRHLKQFDFRRQTDWRALLEVMGACIPALAKTREYITEEAARVGFAEGSAWNQMIWDLIGFADARALPSRVTHFDDPNQASSFVRFVRELQLTFPKEFRRHETSNASLTEAITVARRQTRRAIASREAQKTNSPDQPT